MEGKSTGFHCVTTNHTVATAVIYELPTKSTKACSDGLKQREKEEGRVMKKRVRMRPTATDGNEH